MLLRAIGSGFYRYRPRLARAIIGCLTAASSCFILNHYLYGDILADAGGRSRRLAVSEFQ
jgi:hypothetical protein